MNFRKLLAFAATLATAWALPTEPEARGARRGGVRIVNNLGQDVYLWSVSAVASEMHTVPSGSSYHEHWRINPNGGGVSIKMSTSSVDLSSVLQFEYTKSGDVLYWDMSSIDMSPDSLFAAAGFAVKISDKSCPMVTCAPGDIYCSQSYQFPDDHNTRACRAGAAWTLTLG